MTDEAETSPWERLRQLSEMSVLERPIHVTRWADELMSRNGMEVMPRYFRTAHRDTIAAVLLSLVDDQTAASGYAETGTAGQLNAVGPVDALRSTTYRSDEVPAHLIRTWAKQKGISVNDRGRIPQWVITRYRAEHANHESEKALAYKIREALEQYGELTKSELWNIIGRNHSSGKIEEALKFLPNVQTLEGESSGGRPPTIFRLVEEEIGEIDESVEVTASSQLALEGFGNTDNFSSITDGSSGSSATDSKVYDFLQILRGESHSG
ncbi:Lsr2 family DNA-binding protein [Streptosporangium sp. NBC_01469]|uniref:Lsr2 family DNA-binding protein n=1 Tax=Streptosporangium sp. NBC_01469 TaxID=2903898 RepID=UPI002E2E4781|nr:histone-like nucleoid-structuring protein Lsr2 [Streptosporangium sp. NBC_01469]